MIENNDKNTFKSKDLYDERRYEAEYCESIKFNMSQILTRYR